jgi:hypothetical protein
MKCYIVIFISKLFEILSIIYLHIVFFMLYTTINYIIYHIHQLILYKNS